jgi:hypothetical protein
MRTEPAIRWKDPLETVGPPAPPRTRPTRWLVVALVVLAALFLVATGIAAWQATELADRDAEIVTLTGANDVAVAEVTTATRRAEALTSRVDRLESRLAATVGDEEQIAARLDDARAELDRMLGPALPDGRHFGYLAAVGAAQEPPRVVFDLAGWFTDDEAVAAAIEDGLLPPGSTSIENGYYVRNEDPRWRIVTVDPATEVSLTVYPLGDIDTPRVVRFAAFEELWRLNRRGAIQGFPYWLTVEDGTVTAIGQQFIP